MKCQISTTESSRWTVGVFCALSVLSLWALLRNPYSFIPEFSWIQYYLPFSVVKANLKPLLHWQGGYARSLSGLFVFMGLCGSFLFVGKRILRFLSPFNEMSFVSYPVSWILGSLFFSLVTLVLGSCGLVHRKGVGVLVVLGFVVFLREVPNIWSLFKKQMVGKDSSKPEKFLFVFLLIWVLSWMFIGVIPEAFLDSLITHLALPNYYVLEGKIHVNPYHIHTYFTQNTEMLMMLPLSLKSEVGAFLVHWGFFACVVSLIFGWMSQETSRVVGLFTVFIFIASPHVTWVVNHVKNDLPMAAFLLCHWWALYYAIKTPHWGRYVLCGLFAGGSAGHKLIALPTLVVTLFVVLVQEREKIFKRTWPVNTLFYVLGVLVSVGPWFLRSLILTANPVYPYLSGYFPSKLLSPWHAPIPQVNSIWVLGVQGLVRFFSSLFCVRLNASNDMVFGSVVFMCLAGVVCLGRKFSKPIRTICFLGIVSFLFALLFSLETRYFTAFFVVLFCCSFGFYLQTMIQVRWVPWCVGVVCVSGFLKALTMSSILSLMFGGMLIAFSGVSPEHLPVDVVSGNRYATTLDIRWIHYLMGEYSKPEDRVLYVGIPRTYGSKRRYYASADLDKQVIYDIAEKSKDAKEIYKTLQSMGVKHMIYDPYEWKDYLERIRADKEAMDRVSVFMSSYLLIRYRAVDNKLLWCELMTEEQSLSQTTHDEPVGVRVQDVEAFPLICLENTVRLYTSGRKNEALQVIDHVLKMTTVPFVYQTAYKYLAFYAQKEQNSKAQEEYDRKVTELTQYPWKFY